MPKQFPKEVKVRAVRMVREHADEYDSATAVTAVAKQVGCSPESLRRWCEQ